MGGVTHRERGAYSDSDKILLALATARASAARAPRGRWSRLRRADAGRTLDGLRGASAGAAISMRRRRRWLARTPTLGALALAGCAAAGPALAGCAPAAPAAIPTHVRQCPTGVTPKERADDGVDVIIRCAFYAVEGQSAPDLRRFMSAFGPSDETGTYDAYTAFGLHYGYHDAASDAGCSMVTPTIELHLMHILPAWSPPAGSAEPGLLGRWAHYTSRLSAHEAGHADISVRAANDLSRAFATMPPSPTCGALRTAAHDLFVEAVARLKAQHRRYDRRTSHGATQGSVFP